MLADPRFRDQEFEKFWESQQFFLTILYPCKGCDPEMFILLLMFQLIQT